MAAQLKPEAEALVADAMAIAEMGEIARDRNVLIETLATRSTVNGSTRWLISNWQDDSSDEAFYLAGWDKYMDEDEVIDITGIGTSLAEAWGDFKERLSQHLGWFDADE